MRNGRFIRTVAVLASAGMIVGAFAAAPAEAKKKKKPKGCAAYVPGEAAAEAPITKVTNANTADAPATVEVEVGPGLGIGRDPEGEGAHVSHGFANLQVDSTVGSDLLNVRISWTNPLEDFDLYLDTADGTEIASSGGFFAVNPFPGEYSETGVGSEAVIGVPVSDCDGYTVDAVGATTPGATLTVEYWLGE